MKYTLILILFLGCIIAQDTSSVDSTEKVATTPDLPASFNDYLGTATDTVMVAIEFGLSRVPTEGNEITNYISFAVAKRIRSQDRWKNSVGDLRVEYYIQAEDQWIKFNPGLVLRETPIQQ